MFTIIVCTVALRKASTVGIIFGVCDDYKTKGGEFRRKNILMEVYLQLQSRLALRKNPSRGAKTDRLRGGEVIARRDGVVGVTPNSASVGAGGVQESSVDAWKHTPVRMFG